MTSLPVNLTQEEIDDACEGLTMPAAQCRFLERLGLLVGKKPNGKPLVARSEYERVRGADRFQRIAQAVTGANIVAMRERVAQGKKHGQKA